MHLRARGTEAPVLLFNGVYLCWVHMLSNPQPERFSLTFRLILDLL